MKFKFIFNKSKYILDRDEDLTLIQVAELLGLVIPRFCYHNSLSIAGNCRMCLIEVNTSLKPIVACGFSLTNNLQINTNTKKISTIRESILEFLLINHPLDCPICDSAGECDLQDISLLFGNDLSRFNEKKRSVSDKNFGPFIKTIMTRCIHCTRCIRFIDEYMFKQNGHIGTLGRGVNTIVSNYFNHSFEHDLSGNLADLCPVGALTHRTYAFTARPWELNSIEYKDFIENIPMNIRIDLKGNDIYRIIPIYTKYLQDEFISNKTRYFYDVTFNTVDNKNPLYFYKDNIVKYIKTINWKNLKNILSNNSKTLFDANTYDIYTAYLLKNYSIYNDFKYINNTKNINLRSDFILQNNIFELPRNLLTLNVNLKLQSTILSLKLSKMNKTIYNIGTYYQDNTKKDIGISNNFYNKMLQGRTQTSKELITSFFNLVLTEKNNLKIFNKYIKVNNYISSNDQIALNEAGFVSHYTKYNKNLNLDTLDNTVEMNKKHFSLLKDKISRRVIYTSFLSNFIDKVKYDNSSYNTILIPTLNNLNQNYSYWNIFGSLIINPQITKSRGYDDFTLVKFFIDNKLTNNQINTSLLNNYFINYIPNYYFTSKKIISKVTDLTHKRIKLSVLSLNNNYLSTIHFYAQDNYTQNNIYTYYSKYLKNAYVYNSLYQPNKKIKYNNQSNIISYPKYENSNIYLNTKKGNNNYSDYYKNEQYY